MNLLKYNLWKYYFPWGNTVNPGTDKQIKIDKYLVEWDNDRVKFFTCQGPYRTCWYMDKAWQRVESYANNAIGHMISTDLYYYGTYRFRFRLPNSRGAWPAIWMVDTTGALGMPPEVDIFEHFRKDGFLSRFHITGTYHFGESYENDRTAFKRIKRCGGLLPMDLQDIDMEFHWSENYMKWFFNGKEQMRIIRTTTNKFPDKPMNLIIGAGVGLDWEPDSPMRPFIVRKIEYSPQPR